MIVDIQSMNTFEKSYILIVVATLAAAWWEEAIFSCVSKGQMHDSLQDRR